MTSKGDFRLSGIFQDAFQMWPLGPIIHPPLSLPRVFLLLHPSPVATVLSLINSSSFPLPCELSAVFWKWLLLGRDLSQHLIPIGRWLAEAVHGRDCAYKMLMLMGYESYHFIATEFHEITGGHVLETRRYRPGGSTCGQYKYMGFGVGPSQPLSLRLILSREYS